MRFPITVTLSLKNYSDSSTIVLNNLAEANNFQVNLPFYSEQNNSFTLTITDSCSFTYTKDYTDPNAIGLNNVYFDLNLIPISNTCYSQFNLLISRIEAFYPGTTGYKVTISSTVPGFDASLYNIKFNSAGEGYFSDYNNISLPNVPPGKYTVNITDDCGKTLTKTANISTPVWTLQKIKDWGACTEGSSTVMFGVYNGDPNFNIKSNLTSFTIVSAPAAFTSIYGALPYNANSWIYNGTYTQNVGIVFANNLPAGTYTIEYTDACDGNTVKSGTFTTVGTILQEYNTTKVTTCTGVSLNSTITSNYNSPSLYLQQYFPSLGQWGKPQDSSHLYTEGTEINGSGTAIQLTSIPGNVSSGIKTYSSVGNIFVSGSGHYRVILEHRAWLNGIENGFPIISTAPYQACQMVLEEFDVNVSDIKINNFMVVDCGDGTNTLIIDATGVNLSYQIISKNGLPFVFPSSPQASNVFTNLESGKYQVQISDTCGRLKVVSYYVSSPQKYPVVLGTPFCDSQSGKLYIEGYDYLTYQWYKDGVAISGAAGKGKNTLYFSPYHSATDPGVYSVNISDPRTCLNKTLYYTIKPDGVAPNAGTGQTVTLDINNITTPIDLFNYLTSPYDNSGTWTETSASGRLSDYIWNAVGLTSGTYTFNYTVNSTCSGPASVATVTIVLKGGCYKDPIITGSVEATKVGITTLGRADSDHNKWPGIRRGGHIVLESKSKGFVINRVANPVTDIASPVDGMAVYDTTKQCLSIYVFYTEGDSRNGWKCFNQPSCN